MTDPDDFAPPPPGEGRVLVLRDARGYRALPDRVAVYCFWPDAPMKVEFPDEFRDRTAPGIGIGHRVWNPDRRGLPAQEKNDP